MPGMWKDIEGHAHVVELLKAYSASARIPHAFLFAGVAGQGKTRVAREFFKAVNCLERTGDPCDRCRSCLKAISGVHPDLVEVTPDSRWIKVDEVRGVLSEIGYKPFEARIKFVVIEPAETLNRESANALLKTLEEPPQNTVIVLISHRPKLLLPTLVSRCQVMRFGPMEAHGERPDNGGGAEGATGLSRGASEYLETDQGLKMRQEILELLKRGDPADLARRYFDKSEGSEGLSDALVIVESILRDIMALQHGVDTLLNAELREVTLRSADTGEIEEIAGIISGIRRGVNENINVRNAATELFIRVSRLAAA